MKIGILGGGQLGRMLALAGYPLGIKFRIFDPVEHTSAKQVAEGVTADYSDISALESFAKDLDVITYEFENVPVDTLKVLSSSVEIRPSIDALLTSQDRLYEKELFERLDIPFARYEVADNSQQLSKAVEQVGFPCVVKTRRQGYDGKGQRVLRKLEDYNDQLWQELGSCNLIVEELIPFDREVSQVCAFDIKGNSAPYPLTENVHSGGILKQSTAPSSISDSKIARQAIECAEKIATEFRYTGVLTVEFFVAGNRLIANEIAPRVHNSGHWTQNASIASQFENHIRAVSGMPLGATIPKGFFGMVNFIGKTPSIEDFVEPNTSLHIYGKEDRPGRKVAHANCFASTQSELDSLVLRLSKIIE